jgi:hypothetical protein
MAQMDHREAIQLQAAEKYVLGELSLAQREEYEEHYFDCEECAIDLKAAAAFVDTTREVLRQEKASSFAKDPVPARGGWLRWFRPVTAVPAFAVLLLIFIYQNTVTIPRAKEATTQSAGQLFTSSFSLQMANTRGGEEVKVQVHPKESFALDFDFTPSRILESYVCQLQDESGRSVLQVNVPGSSANKEAHLVVPGGLVRPGRYTMVFSGTPVSKGQPSRDEVLRLQFVIAFL